MGVICYRSHLLREPETTKQPWRKLPHPKSPADLRSWSLAIEFGTLWNAYFQRAQGHLERAGWVWVSSKRMGSDRKTKKIVDGRNPAPVDRYSLSHYLQGFRHPRWCRISSISSILVKNARWKMNISLWNGHLIREHVVSGPHLEIPVWCRLFVSHYLAEWVVAVSNSNGFATWKEFLE